VQFSKVFATVAVLATASACVSTSLTQAEAEQIAKSCRTEVGAVGTYSIRGGGDRMAATPVKGAYGLVDGTDAGAAALNACFKQKISGIPAATSAQTSVGCQKRSNPLQGGTGYC
jgi:hypothetical protein